MDILDEAKAFQDKKMSHMSTVDKVMASKEAKRIILAINEIYKETKEEHLMDLMKELTVKKKSIDRRLKGRAGF